MGYRSKCLLAVDTSAANCAAAIFLNGKIFSTVREMKKGQAEHLFDVIEDTLEQARVKKSQIDLIVVGIGPGNFTGIRIGLAAAKGLALSLKVPLSGVNSFQASLYGQNEYQVAAIQAPQNSYYLGTINGDFRTGHIKDSDAHERFASRPKSKKFIENMAKFGADLKCTLSQAIPLYIKAADAKPHNNEFSMIK